MIAANALLARNPWNRLKPSLSKSVLAKDLLWFDDTPDNVKEALRAPDSHYDASVLTTARYINEWLRGQLTHAASDAVYTPATLRKYDRFVWQFNAPFLWRIHLEEVKGLYNDGLLHSKRHAEIAVGTGLLLRELNVPDSLVDITLLDLNPHSLEACQTLLSSHPHYEYSQVQFTPIQCDILQPVPVKLHHQYDSVAANFLLHCLSGEGSASSQTALRHAADLLKPKTGVLFGTTVLGQALLNDADRAGPAALETLRLYNEWGIFGNLDHTYADLSRTLHELFHDVEVWRTGYGAGWMVRDKKV